MPRWVVGITAVEFQPPRPIFHVVQRRDATTLHRIIVTHCLQGTTVSTDSWRGYRGLRNLNFDHQTVNHQQNFVNPVTGTICSSESDLTQINLHTKAIFMFAFFHFISNA